MFEQFVREKYGKDIANLTKEEMEKYVFEYSRKEAISFANYLQYTAVLNNKTVNQLYQEYHSLLG